jgi:hypothetical protein
MKDFLTSLYKELENEELAKIQAAIQEHEETKPPSIATAKANTMTKIIILSSSSIDISQEHLDKLEKHTREVRSKLLRWKGYDGQGLGKRENLSG